MRTVAIIQARTGSTRLPRKVLRDLEGQSMLQRTLERARRVDGVDEVVIATTKAPSDLAIVEEAERLGVKWFRGSEQDVLSRYLGTAEAFEADVVVRITSDCPLLDPEVSGTVVARLKESLASTNSADYCSNGLPHRTFPRGLDTEAMTIGALERAGQRARTAREREHVSIYLYEHPNEFRLLGVESPVDESRHRWTVDTEEDLRFVREIYRRFGERPFGWKDVLSLLEREPELVSINAHVEQKKA